MLEEPDAVFYNMNEVYLDDIYYHYRWTGDRELLGSLFPVIEGILSWEKRRLDPDDDALYESCLNTWISDSHWYSGGDSTQASAYMYRGYQLAVEAAKAAGKDSKRFQQEAERIRAAMNSRLWLSSEGHYAEFIDRLGLKRIHPEPELPTIYHPIDFGITDPFQAYQMLRFTEKNLRNETEIPHGGRLVWSSNWAPNYDEHYTHSTYDLIFAENLNLAIAYYRAGQFDKAYELVKGAYASMYQGGIPGGLSCHAYANGQQRANEEFADSISMFARTAVEGVFGILPEMEDGIINISPGFPKDWNDASISTPDLSYRFHKTNLGITLETETAQPLRIHFRVPIFDASLAAASINGSSVDVHIEPGIGGSFVDVTGPSTTDSSLNLKLGPRKNDQHDQGLVLRADARRHDQAQSHRGHREDGHVHHQLYQRQRGKERAVTRHPLAPYAHDDQQRGLDGIDKPEHHQLGEQIGARGQASRPLSAVNLLFLDQLLQKLAVASPGFARARIRRRRCRPRRAGTTSPASPRRAPGRARAHPRGPLARELRRAPRRRTMRPEGRRGRRERPPAGARRTPSRETPTWRSSKAGWPSATARMTISRGASRDCAPGRHGAQRRLGEADPRPTLKGLETATPGLEAAWPAARFRIARPAGRGSEKLAETAAHVRLIMAAQGLVGDRHHASCPAPSIVS